MARARDQRLANQAERVLSGADAFEPRVVANAKAVMNERAERPRDQVEAAAAGFDPPADSAVTGTPHRQLIAKTTQLPGCATIAWYVIVNGDGSFRALRVISTGAAAAFPAYAVTPPPRLWTPAGGANTRLAKRPVFLSTVRTVWVETHCSI